MFSVVVFLLLLLVLGYYVALGEDGTGYSRHMASPVYEKLMDGEEDDYIISAILFSTVDGNLHAFDPNLRLKWSISLGDNLVSSYNNWVKNSQTAPSSPPSGAADSKKSKRVITSSDEYSIIPALDGTLIFHSPFTGFKKTSMKVDNLQEKTPFLSIDNELLFSGNKVTKIFGIDSETGIIIQEDGKFVNKDPNSIKAYENRKVLWVARVDYTVSAMDGTRGYERFNITYSEIKPLYSRRFSSRGGAAAGVQQKFNGESTDAEDPDYDDNLNFGVDDSVDMSDSNFFLVGSHISLISTPHGDVYISNFHTNEIRKLSLGSTVTTAYKLVRKIDMTSLDNEVVMPVEISHKIPQPQKNYNGNKKLPEGSDSSQEKDSTFDDDSQSNLPVVVVQGHSGGGIYAVEVDRNGGNGKKNNLRNFYFYGDDEVENDYDEEKKLPIPWNGKIIYKDLYNSSSELLRNSSSDEVLLIESEGGSDDGACRDNVAQCLLALAQYDVVDEEDNPKFIKDNEGWASYYQQNDNLQTCLLGKHYMDSNNNNNSSNSNSSSSNVDDIGDKNNETVENATSTFKTNNILSDDDVELPSFLLKPIIIKPENGNFNVNSDNILKVVNTTVTIGTIQASGSGGTAFIIITTVLLVAAIAYFVWKSTLKPDDIALEVPPPIKDVKPDARVLEPVAPLPKLEGASEVIIENKKYGYMCQVGEILVFNIKLGTGSLMTTVHLGYIKDSNRVCAVKRMVGYGGSRAEREISLMSKLDDHPNVLRYYQHEVVENTNAQIDLPDMKMSRWNSNFKSGMDNQGQVVYLAIQLCVLTLKDFVLNVRNNIQKKDILNENKSSSVGDNRKYLTDNLREAIRQIISGLIHLHSNKVVHRDLKPQNILLTFNDNILSRSVKKQGKSSHSKSDGSEDICNAVYPSLDPWYTLFTGSNKSSNDEFAGVDESNPFNNLTLSDYSNIDKFQVKIADMGLSKEWWTEENGEKSNSYENSRASYTSHSMTESFSFWDHLRNKERREFIDNLKDNKAFDLPKEHNEIVGTIGWQAPEIIFQRNKRNNIHIIAVNASNFADVTSNMGTRDSDPNEIVLEMSGSNLNVSTNSVSNSNSIDGNSRSNVNSGSGGGSSSSVSNSWSNSKSTDLFSLGLVLYYILVPGCHVFGEYMQREANIESTYSSKNNEFAVAAKSCLEFPGSPSSPSSGSINPVNSVNPTSVNYGINDSVHYNIAVDNKLKVLQSPGVLKSRVANRCSLSAQSSDNAESTPKSASSDSVSSAYYYYPEEAFSLIRQLLDPMPQNRLLVDLLHHPLLFNGYQRLTLLEEVSDWIERVVFSGQVQVSSPRDSTVSGSNAFGETKNSSMPVADVLNLLESRGQIIIQSIWHDGNETSSYSFNSTNSVGWDSYLDPLLLQDASKYRNYNYFLIRDLLRFIRNKKHHYYDLPQEIRDKLTSPDKLFAYFETRFPRLLYHCYSVCLYIDKLKAKYYPNTNSNTNEKAFSVNSSDAKSNDTNTNDEEELLDSEEMKIVNTGWYQPADVWTTSKIVNPISVNGVPSAVADKSKQNCKRSAAGHLQRAKTDNRYRTKICNNWETSAALPPYIGVCDRKQNKKGGCDFAHGCIELRLLQQPPQQQPPPQQQQQIGYPYANVFGGGGNAGAFVHPIGMAQGHPIAMGGIAQGRPIGIGGGVVPQNNDFIFDNTFAFVGNNNNNNNNNNNGNRNNNTNGNTNNNNAAGGHSRFNQNAKVFVPGRR